MSSIGKTPSSNEESGWTKYFEEFFSNKNGNNDNDDDNDEEDHNNNNNCYSSIMVSDAASSSAAKRLSNYNKNPHEKEFPLERSVIKSFNNNKKNFKTALLDDDASLQDTATSPLTTSKVLYGNQFEKPKQMEDLKENCSNIEQRDEQKELLDFNGRYDDGCTCTELIKEERPLLNINSFVYGSELYYYI